MVGDNTLILLLSVGIIVNGCSFRVIRSSIEINRFSTESSASSNRRWTISTDRIVARGRISSDNFCICNC
jgi:hypothetical protein